ncbi:Mediator of RNA polymerase II transcription subunit 11 [Frankliniella fusca]|uniref:Mediator of RNA polymerase II transcription subunit 11 n=1 Tax=Frankliniella fusca TaxID=407009 RepID=A0AAE1HTV1_9NEOP|nr:Mediator of RNA polymerase II transcription subunit 11 [Frankliniella fusca]
MTTMTPHWERIQVLDGIEKDIITCIQSAGQALQELSKDKSNVKQAETQTNQFLKTLSTVEGRLHEQINYLTQVSTGQPHEGSGYASQKVLQMAWHRLEHVRSRVNELDNLKNTQIAESAVRAPNLAIGMGMGPNMNVMQPQVHPQLMPPNNNDSQNTG